MIELDVGERSKPAEQVELVARQAKASLILGRDSRSAATASASRARSGAAAAPAAAEGRAAGGIQRRELACAMDPILFARGRDICGGGTQIAVVDDGLADERLEP